VSPIIGGGGGSGGGSTPDSRLYAAAAQQSDVPQNLPVTAVWTAGAGYPIGSDIGLNGPGDRLVINTDGVYAITIQVEADSGDSAHPVIDYVIQFDQTIGTSLGNLGILLAFHADSGGDGDALLPITFRFDAGDEFRLHVTGSGPAGVGDNWTLEGGGSTSINVIRLA
jgi:hypothetical protein